VKRSIHRQAAEDLAEIKATYERTGSARLAARFLDEFERVANLLTENPGLGKPFDLPRRIFVHKPTDEGIRVLAVRHQHRDPAYGRDRS